MPRHTEQQSQGLQQPDNSLQDATGRGGVEQHTLLSTSTKEMLIGAGVLGLGLATATETQAQQDESEDDLDTAPVIGTLTVGPGVLFRTEATTRSSSVQRDRSLNTYDVIDVVEGQSVSLNGTTSTEWYHIRIPGETARYAFVSAAVRPQYTELQLPTATATPTLTPTETATLRPTATPTETATATPEQEITTPEVDEVVGIATVKEDAAVVVSNPQVRVTARTNTILGEADMNEELQVVEVIMDGANYGGSRIWYGVILPDDFLQADRPAPTATPTPTPSPTPDASYEMRNVNGRGQVAIGYVSFSQVRFRLPDNPSPTREAPTITEEVIPTNTTTLRETENGIGDGFVTLEELEAFPQTIRYTFEGLSPDGVAPGVRTPVSVELDLENVSSLRGIDGQRIPFGFYVDERPPIDPELFTERYWVGSTEMQYGYVSGILTHIEVDVFGGVLLGVSVPIETTGQYATLHVNLGGNGQKVALLDEFGTQTRALISMPGGTNNPDYPGAREGNGIYFSSESQRFTYPTASGLGQIHVGQQLLVRFLVNDRQIAEAEDDIVIRSQVIGSDDRSATEVLAAITDDQRRNDGRVVWRSHGLVLPEAGISSGT